MTDAAAPGAAVGVSDLAAGPPLPTDPAGAATMRAQLVSDAEYMKDWQSNLEKQSQLGYLRWVAVGNDPARWGKPPEEVSDVMAKAGERAVQFFEAHADVLDRHFDLTPEQQHEVLFQRPVLQWDKDNAERQRAAALKDEAFMSAWRKGDRVAQTKMYLWSAMRAAPLARSVAEVEAWIAENPFQG